MIRLLFLLFLIPFFTLSAQAQQCFKAFIGGREVTELCVGTPFKLVDNSGTTGATEFYDIDDANKQFDNGQVNDSFKTFTFTSPGTYVVTQLLTIANQPNSTCSLTFVVRPTPPPAFTILQCGPDQAKVTIQDPTYDSLYLF